MEPVPLEPVDSVTVTTLVDNMTDLLLTDEGPATRSPFTLAVRPELPARFLENGRTGDALRAEHGFSCLVTIEKAGRTTNVLFDAGLTPDGLTRHLASAIARRLESLSSATATGPHHGDAGLQRSRRTNLPV